MPLETAPVVPELTLKTEPEVKPVPEELKVKAFCVESVLQSQVTSLVKLSMLAVPVAAVIDERATLPPTGVIQSTQPPF